MPSPQTSHQPLHLLPVVRPQVNEIKHVAAKVTGLTGQGFTNVTGVAGNGAVAGEADLFQATDPVTNTEALRLWDNDNGSVVNAEAPLSSVNYDDLWNHGGSFKTVLRVDPASADGIKAGALWSISSGSNTNWIGGVQARVAISMVKVGTDLTILQDNAGPVLATIDLTSNEYHTIELSVVKQSDDIELYVDGNLEATIQWSTLGANVDLLTLTSWSNSSVDGDAWIKCFGIVTFSDSELVLTRENFITGTCFVMPGYRRDYILTLPSEYAGHGGKVKIVGDFEGDLTVRRDPASTLDTVGCDSQVVVTGTGKISNTIVQLSEEETNEYIVF